MTIVVLDGYTLNPGDLSWEPLESLGTCFVYDRTPPDRILERAARAEIVLTNKTPISEAVLTQLPRLRYIGVLATGYNVVDVEAAARRGIPVTNVPAYSTASVAQMVFAQLLNFTQQISLLSGTVREGRWSASADFCYWDNPLMELSGRTMGIVGYGRIGQAVARLAAAFGMDVIAANRRGGMGIADAAVRVVTINDLFRLADVVTLHCPLTDETRRLVNAERLAFMKPSSILINTSRGPLVDEQALADALNSGRIAGAGLDVLSEEPPAPGNPLLHARNCCITPHVAWATTEARARLLSAAADNVAAFLAGSPRNAVNMV